MADIGSEGEGILSGLKTRREGWVDGGERVKLKLTFVELNPSSFPQEWCPSIEFSVLSLESKIFTRTLQKGFVKIASIAASLRK